MNPRQSLDDYLDSLRQRLRLAIFTRAGAVLAATVLVLLCTAVYVLSLRGFPVGGVILSRVVLLLAVVALIAALIWLPLQRLKKNAGADQFELKLPDQDGRIQTYLEQTARDSKASLLTDLLAEDALARAKNSPVEQIVSSRHIWIASGVAAAAVLALLGMLVISRSEWGYGG